MEIRMKKKCSGKRGYWVIFSVLALFALVCIVRALLPGESVYVPGELVIEENTEAADRVIYEGISLKPGVWRVEVEYTTDTDYKANFSIQDGTVFTGGLKTNGEVVYENKGSTGFCMWLYEATDSLQVTASYSGQGSLAVHGVRFVETPLLWTMLLTVDCFGALVVFLLMCYQYRWKETLSREQKTAIWGIGLITLFASFFPLTGEGVRGIDLVFHYLRVEGVKDGILSGQIPVRIEPEWLFGQGFACAIFYCDILLVIPAFFRLAGFTVVTSCNLFFILLNFATAMIAYHSFKKIFGSIRVGLACSALYTLSTYRIYKLFQTGDFGDSTALTFYPLILYGYYRVFTENPEDRKYKTVWLPLTIGYAGLMQTHVLTCEITLFLTILLCLICIRKVVQKKVFLELAKGAAGAFALSLWYVVPFADYYLTQDVHIKNLTARMIQSRGMTPVHLFFHFWRQGEFVPQGNNGAYHTYAVGVGLVLLAALGVFYVLWVNRFPGVEKKDSHVRFGKIAAGIATLLLLMSMNSFPWDRIQSLHEAFAPFISSLEFQTRFLGWATALLISAFGVCLWYFEQRGLTKCFWGGVLAVILSVTTSTCFMSEYVLEHQGTLRVYNAEGMGSGFVSDSEFVLEGTKTSELTVENPVWQEDVEVSNYEKYYLSVKMDCKNNGAEEAWVDLPILSYRDYRARTGEGEELEVTHNERYQVRVLLPAGFEGHVRVRFESPFYWRISEVISLLMLVFLVGRGIYRGALSFRGEVHRNEEGVRRNGR